MSDDFPPRLPHDPAMYDRRVHERITSLESQVQAVTSDVGHMKGRMDEISGSLKVLAGSITDLAKASAVAANDTSWIREQLSKKHTEEKVDERSGHNLTRALSIIAILAAVIAGLAGLSGFELMGGG